MPRRQVNDTNMNFSIQIWGPVLQELSSVDNLNVSVAYLYQNVNGPEKEGSDLLTRHANCIDVRDVASIHVDVLEAGDAVANQRLLLGACKYTTLFEPGGHAHGSFTPSSSL